jgi:hypothetical protein
MANGGVRNCCHQDVGALLGNVLTDDFESIWEGQLARAVREETLAGNLHPICRTTDTCPHLYTDRAPSSRIDSPGELPVSLELSLPNTECNVGGTSPTPETACLMCPRGSADFHPIPDRTSEMVSKLRFLMPRMRELQIQGLAEIFWKDRIFEVLEQFGFGKFRDRCRFVSHSNATVFHRRRRKRFLEACPKATLSFSIDAATEETYVRIRRLDVFDRVLSNIRGYMAERSGDQVGQAMFNLNELNLHEAVQMTELAASLGVDAAVFTPTSTLGRSRTDLAGIVVSRENARRFLEAEERIRDRAQQLGLCVAFPRPLDLGLAGTRPLREKPRGAGHFDALLDGVLHGWAWDPSRPGERVVVDIYDGAELVSSARADLDRSDLRDLGIGDGGYGFQFKLPPSLLDRDELQLTLRRREGGIELQGSPLIRSRGTRAKP